MLSGLFADSPLQINRNLSKVYFFLQHYQCYQTVLLIIASTFKLVLFSLVSELEQLEKPVRGKERKKSVRQKLFLFCTETTTTTAKIINEQFSYRFTHHFCSLSLVCFFCTAECVRHNRFLGVRFLAEYSRPEYCNQKKLGRNNLKVKSESDHYLLIRKNWLPKSEPIICFLKKQFPFQYKKIFTYKGLTERT